jgi:signal transduction histidine kinase
MIPLISLSWFYTLNKATKFILIISMIIIIAYVDMITPPELSIRLFYLIPLFLSVWDGSGIMNGLYFSIVCTVSYFYSEWLQHNIHWHGFYLAWEMIIVWSFFFAFVLVLEKLKKFNLLLLRKNEELEKINNQKDKFFSIIAHDLKSPFQGFLGVTQSLAEDTSSFSTQEIARLNSNLNKVASNLFSLLRNLLEWAQMQKGEMSFQPNEISLTDLAAKNIELIKERSAQKGIAVINNVSNPIQIFADENMINSVLLNLLTNAVKFTRSNGTVTVRAYKAADDMVEVSVSDTGIGMSKGIVDKLFIVGEKTGTPGTEGELSTGLGLLLCKEFVEKHGGKIWVQSEEGKGSTFYFTLPQKKSFI